MPQSLSNVLVHSVFSTKERHPFLSGRSLRMAMHKHLAAVSTELRCPVIKVGGVEDHVHLLARQARTVTLDERYLLGLTRRAGVPPAQGSRSAASLGCGAQRLVA